ncbi:siderophore ABC transporter substrate-binding protein [Cellulomonas pakistanensis]|uniref:Iron ABC transporter substrate-binding protein n=1 Tax=Cellulomonas pakistanensis TaxID=992287 RepID=A0A919P8V1_9CELL|nr:ABC transporter substrate-binding protein [Cellulomonas pakistanensis]GIG36186.1 iron ABC transporter substrate-binding protein [Cellulomonas pakistanensis]
MPTRTSHRRLAAVLTAAPLALALAACGGSADAGTGTEAAETTSAATTVTIEDNHGSVEVPVNPERVVALDNHVFETLSAWDVPLVAAPKGIMGDGLWPAYTEDESVLDVGTHREPNLESIVAAEPDLIIGGYRFSDSYDDIKAQNPDAVVIELHPREGEEQSDELVRQVEALGQIFGREDEAAQIVADYDQAVADATDAYDGESTVVGLITSGGEISYSAPVTGRSIGTLFPTLGLQPAIEQEAEDTSHGDDISVEAIAAANPDWIIVLDRDGAGVGEGEYRPAAELIGGSEALQSVTAVAQDQVVYLDPDFYLTEDIQAYTALYEQVAQAFADAA